MVLSYPISVEDIPEMDFFAKIGNSRSRPSEAFLGKGVRE